MKIEIRVQPSFELALPYQKVVAPLMILSNYHYDATCKAASQPGGFIYGWRNVTENTEHPEMALCTATWRELDTLLKICEGARIARSAYLITDKQHFEINQLCQLVLTAFEVADEFRTIAPLTLVKPSERGKLRWSTSPGRM